MRFNHLNIPETWVHYFTKYPNGLSLMEALIEWVSQVDAMVDRMNATLDQVDALQHWFDNLDLTIIVGDKMDQYVLDGTLATIINQQIFNGLDSRLGVVEVDLAQALLDINFLMNNPSVLEVKKINVKDPKNSLAPAIGDGVTDDTQALLDIISYARSILPCELYFPAGTYRYTSLGNLNLNGLTLRGAGDRSTILKCISNVNAHDALLIDAFADGLPQTQFLQKINLIGLTIEGNSLTQNLIKVQGLARSNWDQVTVREGGVAGVGFNFLGVMLCNFKSLICSTDLDPSMVNVPQKGMLLTQGLRAGVSVGGSTNNIFESCYFEGTPFGIYIDYANNNNFIGGSPESNTIYGVVIHPNSKFNTFIGVGFESDNSVADVADNGVSTQYINCYSSKKMLLQGKNIRISGGYFETIEVQALCEHSVIENVVINYFFNNGVYLDNGLYTVWSNIYDHGNSVQIYPFPARVGITVGASPFTFTNDKKSMVEVVIQSGTITSLTRTRPNSGTFQAPTITPNSILLYPGESITIQYTIQPSMSYMVNNNIRS